MKSLVFGIAVGVSVTLFAASSQVAKAPPGTDNIAAGYGAGFQSSGSNSDVICLGTDAGMGTTNNHNCVFIGKEAGKGVVNKNEYIDIGGRINIGSSSLSICGQDWSGTDINIGGMFKWGVKTSGSAYTFHQGSVIDCGYVNMTGYDVKGPFNVYAQGEQINCAYFNNSSFGFSKPIEMIGASIYFGSSEISKHVEIQNLSHGVDIYGAGGADVMLGTESGDISIWSGGGLTIHANGKDVAYLLYTEGSNNLEVYVGGTKKGTIQFTPVAQ